MYGIGIIKGFGVTLRHFFQSFADDLQWFGRRNGIEAFQTKQSLKGKGVYTVQYPEEKIAVPERFRFIPFLVTYNNDDPEYPGKDWCTTCGICAKVCPPQCIWIVQTKDPTTGRPKPEPEAFFIDIDVCMNCGYCAEYCPFDAIKMDHDYELASYDRTGHHIYDKAKLSKEVRYWQAIAPTVAAQEQADRGGYDHKDVQKLRGKAGLVKSRPGPTSDKAPEPVVAAATVAAPAAAAVTGVAAPAETVSSAPASAVATGQTAAPGAAFTADGKPIVRRRGAGGAAAPAAGASPAAPAQGVVPVQTAAKPAPAQGVAAPAPAPAEPVNAAPPAPAASTDAPPSAPSGPKPRDPNAPVQVVRRRNNPPPKKD
jgi:NADH-quinone oxidoreductase subunit I